MTTIIEHARAELQACGQMDSDPEFSASLLAAIEGFTTYGHSGGSAEMGVDLLVRLMRREALTPITSDPADWEDRSEMSGSPMWQNRRDSRAMSTDGGKTWWYVEGRHPGERTHAGGALGTLQLCGGCAGAGLVHHPDTDPAVEPVGASA